MKNVDIMRYVGSINAKTLSELSDEFLQIARSVRSNLGSRGALFDEYIAYLLSAVSTLWAEDAAGTCMRGAYHEFRSLCEALRRGDENAQSHPFYHRLKQTADETPSPNEEVFVDFYFSLLWAEYAEHALSSYIEQVKADMEESMKETGFREIEGALLKVADPEALQRLRDLLYESHSVAAYSRIVAQGFAEQDILSLLSIDSSGRYVFQYLFNA